MAKVRIKKDGREFYIDDKDLDAAKARGFVEAAPATETPQPDDGNDVATGLGAGLAWGMAPHIAGAYGAAGKLIGERVAGVAPEFRTSPTDAYKEAAALRRRREETSRERSPVVSTLAELVGAAPLAVAAGAASPAVRTTLGRVVSGAKQGATAGAVQGLGDMREMSADEFAKVIEGGGAGALFGAAVPAAGGAGRRILSAAESVAAEGPMAAARRVVGAAARDAGKNADRLRALTMSGATSGTIDQPALKAIGKGKIPTDAQIARFTSTMRKEGMDAGPFGTTEQLVDIVEGKKAEAGKFIGDTLEQIKAKGGYVDGVEFQARIDKKIAELRAFGTNEADDFANALQKEFDRTQKYLLETKATRLPIDRAQEWKEEFGARARQSQAMTGDPMSPARGKAAEVMREEIVDAMDATAERELGPAARAEYQRARRTYEVAKTVVDQGNASLGRASKNTALPGEAATATIAAAPSAAAAALLLMRNVLLKNRQAHMRAAFAEKARDIGEKWTTPKTPPTSSIAPQTPDALQELIDMIKRDMAEKAAASEAGTRARR